MRQSNDKREIERLKELLKNRGIYIHQGASSRLDLSISINGEDAELFLKDYACNCCHCHCGGCC